MGWGSQNSTYTNPITFRKLQKHKENSNNITVMAVSTCCGSHNRIILYYVK